MTDLDRTDPIDIFSAGGAGPRAALATDNDPMSAFRSEELTGSISTDKVRTPKKEISIGGASVEWCPTDDPLSLFHSESSPAAVSDADTGQAPAQFTIEFPASERPTRSSRLGSFVPRTVVMLRSAILVLGGVAGIGLVVDSFLSPVSPQPITKAPSPAEARVPPMAPRPVTRADEPRRKPAPPTHPPNSPRLHIASLAPAPTAAPPPIPDRGSPIDVIDTSGDGTVLAKPLVLEPDFARAEANPTLPTTLTTTMTVVESTRGLAATPAEPAAVPVMTPAPSPTIVPATTAIESALNRYVRAFSALDVREARAVWPSVDERTLRRAFERLEQQQFELEACTIDSTGTHAVASCAGTARYVPKVGSKGIRSERRQWTFRLQHRGQEWSIEAVDSR